jgi:hypothetical protein
MAAAPWIASAGAVPVESSVMSAKSFQTWA